MDNMNKQMSLSDRNNVLRSMQTIKINPGPIIILIGKRNLIEIFIWHIFILRCILSLKPDGDEITFNGGTVASTR